MAWTIEITPEARKQLRQLDRQASIRILRFLDERVASAIDPKSLGTALKGRQFENVWRYRVGDYRILARIKFQIVTVQVVRIGHRREIYT